MLRSLSGTVGVQILSADIHRILAILTNANVAFYDLQFVDELTVRFVVSRQDHRRMRKLLQKSGAKIEIVTRNGLYWTLKGLLRRPVLVLGIAIYILLVLAVPSRIFFVRIEGNSQVPEREILEAASECGIVFGAHRRQVRSEQIKNALLQKLPALQWVGVNTRGCVAVISVTERQEDPISDNTQKGSILASRDAIIRQITVLRGTQMCRVGQAVKAGQLLVSGYKDYGISQKFTGAVAEIYGQTERHLEAVAMASGLKRTKIVTEEKKYSLIIGKKQINFYKDSGILDTSCVRMYKRMYLSLPGGYVLPLALVEQRICYYDTAMVDAPTPAFLETASRAYLMRQMTAGSILTESVSVSEDAEVFRLSGKYECLEMIAVTTTEEFLSP